MEAGKFTRDFQPNFAQQRSSYLRIKKTIFIFLHSKNEELYPNKRLQYFHQDYEQKLLTTAQSNISDQ